MTALGQVLLTGATGSLGGQLCRELLARTPATVQCLVRAADPDHARRRILDRLGSLDDPLPATGRRLTAAPVDLAAPLLGLDRDTYDALAQSITAIVHCAAEVDLAADYGRLAPANVTPTRQLVSLARRRTELTGRAPHFHYVSTLGVFLDARRAGTEEVDEGTEVSERTSGQLGYPRSKAVSELALRAAAETDGLPVSVYRPAFVTGHSRTGRTSSADLLTPCCGRPSPCAPRRRRTSSCPRNAWTWWHEPSPRC
ncbi:SDR family oxidoreductase [Streptomyces sp. Ac-502]|uniref:SDR family oxidoreductase n=1 Tax=Streptomyces sp. Ac-502 TaxID=3342801 RepID=UPI003862573A